MPKHRIFTTSFSSVYPLYVQKAERKNRTKVEVDQIICWLTGYDQAGLQGQIDLEHDFETFFAQAPQINPNVSKITGVICGYRVEEIEDKLMQKIRYLDKLIDELAKAAGVGDKVAEITESATYLAFLPSSKALRLISSSLAGTILFKALIQS